MDNNHRWRPQDQHYHHNHHQEPPQQTQQNIRYGSAAADSVHNAQGLLAVYPMASATPTNHAVRHVSNMYTTAAPPTFAQPSYYTPHTSHRPQGNPPPYSEYDQQVRYLSSPQPPVNDGGYWTTARDNTVRILADQPPSSYRYPTQRTWHPPQGPVSSFQTTPFAQSVFQRTAPPSNAYPTPSPPIMQTSSSSLAHALGPPPPPAFQPRLPPPLSQKVYRPEESRAFFNTFLEQKTREMKAVTQARPPPPASPVKTPTAKAAATTFIKGPPDSSPDPLSVMANSSPVPVTPRKRKPVVEIESPSLKRMQTIRNEYVPSPLRSSSLIPSVPSTPSSKSTASTNSQGPTPTPKRVANLAYVSVPTWLTPQSRQSGFVTPSMSVRRHEKSRMDDTPDDLGGYGTEDGYGSPIKRRGVTDSIKSSARRTGDRDDRAPLEKFLCLVEDIFESEDSLPSEINIIDLPEYFSSLSIDSSRPHLHSNHIRKLTKYIGQVARPSQRLRNTTAGVMSTPRVQGRMAEIDTRVLSRLLKILDRTVGAGEDLDPFRYIAPPPGSAKSSPRKKSTKARKTDGISQSQAPREGSDDFPSQEADHKVVEEDDRETETELTHIDYGKLSQSLDVARESILAGDCCIALLGSDRLTKQLYSEELIISCFNAVKNQLEKIIYPFVETSSGAAFELGGNPMLRFVVKDSSSTASGHRKQLSELFQALASVIPRINNLVNAETVAMSDAIIISAVYIAIGPFFVVEGGEGESKSKKEKDNVVLKTFGRSAMRGLRLDALGLIRSIFANHESQRSWIIEEILTSLIKLSDTKQKAGQFRLRDGRSIRTVSALLLQLVQTSAHDVRLKARKIEKNRQNQLALKRQESFSDSQQPSQEPFLDENDHEEIVLYKGGLDSAMQAAKTIIGFLTKRSGKGKATKNSNEAEYRTIFDNLIGDLLVVLFWPEWPAAGVLLTMICKYMVNALGEKHVHAQVDSNAAKTIALDHLGVIAARIRSATLKFQVKSSEETKVRPLKSMDETVADQDVKALERLLKAHRDVMTHLAKRSSEDQAYDSARELSAALLGQELACALQQLQTWIEAPELDDDLNIKDPNKLQAFAQKVRGALREVWKDPPTDVFDIGSQEEADRIDQLGEQIGTLQNMRSSFDPILNTIVASLNASVIFIRTKALRALGQIVTSDPTVLSMSIVRRGIENHLLDSSPAVRDAAVELIGKYMIDSPEVAGGYYQKIADRMADTGLSVRKRVIKLLKSFYSVTQDNDCKTDIATRMVARMVDEDDTVKELATKTIEELWFPTASFTSANIRGKSILTNHNLSDKNSTLAKVIVIMGTAAQFKERQSPLEDLLHKIMAEKPETEVPALHARYSEICETLIDGLVDATDLPGFTVVNCIRTIYLFTSAYPPVLSGTNASTLLPYLKNASTSEELITTDYLLKIFRVSIPHMPQKAGKFGQELQSALQPMIIKPSGSGGVQILQEAVGCMCVVVQHLTHDFIRLVNLLKSCNIRLQQALKRPASAPMEDKEARPLVILILIVALLGEHCNFDRLRTENGALAKDLDAISKGPIVEHIYDTLLQLYEKHHGTPMVRGRTLQCLGFLFRAQPTLMTKERSASIMDAIFASPEEDGKGRILRIMQEFLVSESEKHSTQLKETTKAKSNKSTDVNMDELVGNTDGFADSGVSSAIVQRYLGQVLEAALSPASQNQAAAVDVLSFTIKQGLAHPLQSFPVIIALETSPITSLSNRATALHAILQGKHASLLNTRYIVSARASFDYQKKVVGSQVVKGYRIDATPVALLQRWFSLVREKRLQRQEFLKSLVKVFQENSDYRSSQDDVDFMRYMAENFATFDYKTQEEVITVIKHLTTALSTTGMQLLELISPSHLLSQLHAPLQPVSESVSQANPDTNVLSTNLPPEPQNTPVAPVPDEDNLDKLPLMRTSVIISMVMLLKAHLKSLYSLSEEKCNKFVIGKKSAAGDKPATRRHDKPISWDRLPYATSPMLTTEDIKVQKTKFLGIWNEDGVTAEPDDELEFA